MAKIMLVEDDNNLREIYEARLLAEGYEIVSAEDGEQALALAVKEKPDLIISDIMMPKISGFDMLDILRSTPETKNTKVIMMTALSQAEDKARADKLGADRYLVKSQVTLEDVAKVAREVLQDEDTVPAASVVTPTPSAPVATPTAPISVAAEPSAPPAAPAPVPAPAPAEPPKTPPDEPPAAPPAPPAEPPAPKTPVPPPAEPPATGSSSATTSPAALGEPTVQEQAEVKDKIEQFIDNMPAEKPAASTGAQTPSTDATATAADNAAKLAETVNTLLQKQGKAPESKEPSGPKPHNQISGKKTISPITDMNENKGPSLNELLAKEAGAGAVAPAPATSVVSPSGQTVTPPAPGKTPSVHAPGNVIQPAGNNPDPNSIAL